MVHAPFKWPGGKTRLVPQIVAHLPMGKRLVEPFCGSCALSLNRQYDAYLLNDINLDLMAFYLQLQADGEMFIEKCRMYFSKEGNTLREYLRLREYFNKAKDLPEILLYLNRHCFNGLIRYNSKGRFNTPFGRYAAPYFPEEELRDMYQHILSKDVTLSSKDFRKVFSEDVTTGDVVYCDPPYIALSATSSFTAYAAGGFTEQDQRDLAACAVHARDTLKVPVLVSNSDTPLSREIFSGATRIETVFATRHISAKSSSRGPVQEILALYLP